MNSLSQSGVETNNSDNQDNGGFSKNSPASSGKARQYLSPRDPIFLLAFAYQIQLYRLRQCVTYAATEIFHC